MFTDFRPTHNSDNRFYNLNREATFDDIIIGSTVKHVFYLPFNFDSYIKDCFIIYKQGLDIVIVKNDYEVYKTPMRSVITVTLSPNETRLFKNNTLDTTVQMKVTTVEGDTIYDKISKIKLRPALDTDSSPEKYNSYSELTKVKDYLYEISYQNIDYNYAYKKFKSEPELSKWFGGCTAIKYNKYLGRNFDWTYDNNPEFVVKIPRMEDRFASMGIAGTIPGFTAEFVDSREYSELYKILPFRMLDGVNEYGLSMEVNVVPSGDKGVNLKSVPNISEELEICNSMLIRYVLDHFKTAKEAAEYIRDYVSVYNGERLVEMNYEPHFIIADKTDTYLLEFISQEDVSRNVIKNINDKPYMTNFHLTDVEFNEDGSVYTPETKTELGSAMTTNHITANGSGLERFNIINYNYNNLKSKDDLFKLLNNNLRYTNSYTLTDNIWYTEFVGNGLTPDSNPSDFDRVLYIGRSEYGKRDRDYPMTWQSTHTVIYDLSEKSMLLAVQESNNTDIFKYNKLITFPEA